MSEPSAIRFEAVSKAYPGYGSLSGGFKRFLLDARRGLHEFTANRREVLRDVSFTVSKGEAFGIVGRNGAGKSTLLGLAAMCWSRAGARSA